jgi:signal transduction histidine kinase
MADTLAKRDPPPSRTLLQAILHDRVLVSALVVCVLLIGYQLSVTLLQPPWIKPVTDWLRTALAWPQLAIEAWVAVRLHQMQRRDAVTGYCITLGLLFYAVARTTFTIADVVIYPHGVSYPSLPDLFFILQYPCFAAALFLYDPGGRWLPNVRVIVDAVLWMSAVTALSWYFVLIPLSLQTREPPLGKSTSILHQVADLMLFYGLVVALTRPCRTISERLVVSLMGLAVLSLFIADTWAAVLLLHPPYTYRTGSAPDLFWFICYLLLPLAALVRLRLVPADLPSRPSVPAARLTSQDVLAGMQVVSPSAAVVVAGVMILVLAERTAPRPAGLSAPQAVGIALLLLATLRPAVMFLEQEQLRRERDAARAQERALQIANARMEAFLSMVAHELKTPLTSLVGNVHLIARRLDVLLRLVRNHEDYTDIARVLGALIGWCDQSLDRMARLVEDVLDETRVRHGQLALRLEPRNLASVMGEALTEQAVLNPERTIRWVSEGSLVPVFADASRVAQVVTNYLSNALKFSGADQPVEVCLRTEDGLARVSVHDDGVGIPLADQSHIWDRFYQAKGAGVKSGSQVGFGIGLYISKAIIEGHHGQVGVESAPSQGTTFWFTLPLAPPLATASPEAGTGSPASRSDPGERERDP